MADEWQRAEVLLEEIRRDVKAIAEGHSFLNKKIDDEFDEVNEKIDDVSLAIKEISHDLQAHIRQTNPPAHVPV